MGKCEFVAQDGFACCAHGDVGTTVKWPGRGMAVAGMADARAVGLSVQLTGRQGTGGIRTVF